MSRDHSVLFYDHARHAVDQLADYVAEGLYAGEAVITVLMPAHAHTLGAALQQRGVDVERDQDEGRLFLLDAGETLSTFLVDGVPDRQLFAQGVGTLLSGLNESGRRVRAAGEMVALLWAEGNVTGALALEAAWNRLADDLDFDLLCPYPATVLDGGRLDVVGRLCALHTDVVAPETYASGPDRLVAPGLTTGVFVPAPEAVGAARRLVALALADWSAQRGRPLDELLVADACLVASEMAANAVTHARSAFEVTVTCSENSVRVSVSDVAPGTVEEHHGRLLDLGGRGLAIVSDVADHWGCETVPGGKVVWAELLTGQPVTL
ncbi:MAG: MEDS domain-containing protein [Actinomycetales bacterium]